MSFWEIVSKSAYILVLQQASWLKAFSNEREIFTGISDGDTTGDFMKNSVFNDCKRSSKAQRSYVSGLIYKAGFRDISIKHWIQSCTTRYQELFLDALINRHDFGSFDNVRFSCVLTEDAGRAPEDGTAVGTVEEVWVASFLVLQYLSDVHPHCQVHHNPDQHKRPEHEVKNERVHCQLVNSVTVELGLHDFILGNSCVVVVLAYNSISKEGDDWPSPIFRS